MLKNKNPDEYVLDDWLHITEWLINTVDEIEYDHSLVDVLALVSSLVATGAKVEKKTSVLTPVKYPLKRLAMQMAQLQATGKIKYPMIFLASKYDLTLTKGNKPFINLTNGQKYGTPENEWYGRLFMDGKLQFAAGMPQSDMTLITDILEVYNENPALFAKVTSEQTGNCSFCKKSLTHPVSLSVGYGPTCARNYGLPWQSEAVNLPE